jgi:D-alanyl-D-alanine carboxypeptidase
MDYNNTYRKRSFSLHSHYLRIFLGSFLITFLMVTLQLFGVHLPNIISPLPTDKVDTMKEILPKLHATANTYSLKKPLNFVSSAYASDEINQANAYAVLDYDTGTIITEKNGQAQVPIASLTKIMTAIVALDLAKPTDVFTATQTAADEVPTKIGVKPGQQFTLDELLHAALMTSANDAVEVIREGVDQKYNDTIFIKAMNEKAKFLGLKHSHFMNPQGFDNDAHYSSAEDLAILTHYALQNYPEISGIVDQDFAHIDATAHHTQLDLNNWNGLLDVYPNVSGVKIGNTDAALMTTIVLSERSGKKILVVLLGAPTILDRDLWASQLLDLGFAKTVGLPPVNVTKEQLQAKYATWKYWN